MLKEEQHITGLAFYRRLFWLMVRQCRDLLWYDSVGGASPEIASHYGHLEILTAYTPVHSHAKTITYRAQVDTANWMQFFTREPDLAF